MSTRFSVYIRGNFFKNKCIPIKQVSIKNSVDKNAKENYINSKTTIKVRLIKTAFEKEKTVRGESLSMKYICF